MHHCKHGGTNYSETNAFRTQNEKINLALGPVAKRLKLAGSEWRQDFRCGPGHTVPQHTSRSYVLSAAACNPDSTDRYSCNFNTLTCTDSPGKHFKGASSKEKVVDFRNKKAWERWRMTTHFVHLLLEKYIELYKRRKMNQHLPNIPKEKARGNIVEGISKQPRWYYINMAKHLKTANDLETSLQNVGVKAHDIERVEAVTPKIISKMMLIVHGAHGEVEKAVTLSHLRAIKMAWDYNQARALNGLPPVLSIILEDDVSMELTRLWKTPTPSSQISGEKDPFPNGITLADVFRALNDKNEDWELCQLSQTCYAHSDCIRFVTEMAESLIYGNAVIQRQSKTIHASLWGAVAYVLSPRGQARILDKLWPGGKDGPSFEDLPKNAQFFADYDSVVADFLLFSSTKPSATFFSARPMFSSKTEFSNIHSSHLANQDRSKFLMRSVLFHEVLTD